MSRHRNVRKVSLADDDYEDDLSQSFDENYSYAISPGTTEMYMYKRNAQQQSMSEFIKDSSIQEEETDTKETDKAVVQKDEDFMFQMDKEPVNLKSEQKQPDDLDSLILNSKLYDDHDMTLINAEEEDGKEFDLDSLAKMYTSDSKPMEINFGLDHLIKSDQAEKMSTSIDNLLDNFFTNNFKDKNYQRTKSISISEEKVPREENAFSLSDLASEYLSNMTPSSTHTPLGSSLVDLIDHEFTKRLSINEDFEEKKVDLKENLIINKRDRARFSIGSDLASSSFSSTTSAKNEPISLNKIQFVPVVREIISDLKIKTLFHLDAESEIESKETKKINENQPSTPRSQKSQSKPCTPSAQAKAKANTAQKSQVSKQTAQLGELRISPIVDAVAKDKLLKQYEEHTAGKDVLNLIVIGHVDSGKSTLMGHLLYQMGQVSDKQLHRYRQDSQKIGKSSFAYAWVLDETEEERSRGITIDVAQTKFETNKKIIYLLDAPGHKDFIPNMITGATQADSAILVINSVTGEFETGFDLGGQTREHSLLVKSLGINQLIVAVNKMDMCDWSESRFLDIHKKLSNFLIKQVGFKETDLMFVPCSGLQGENLSKTCMDEKLTCWYNESKAIDSKSIKGGLTLLECVDRLKHQERSIDKPFRFCISDIFKSAQTANLSLVGKCEAGTVKQGDKITIVPANETGVVKSISTNDEVSIPMCFAGDSATLNVAN
ncbi:HBS1 isoform X1, partial [Brachionus plicatilis]